MNKVRIKLKNGDVVIKEFDTTYTSYKCEQFRVEYKEELVFSAPLENIWYWEYI